MPQLISSSSSSSSSTQKEIRVAQEQLHAIHFNKQTTWIKPELSTDLNELSNIDAHVLPPIKTVHQIHTEHLQLLNEEKKQQSIHDNNANQTNLSYNRLTNPWQVRVMEDVITQLPIPEFYLESRHRNPPKSLNELYENLRSKQLHLHQMPAWLESKLLVEAGEFQMENGNYRKFPSCSQEKSCVGYTLQIRGQYRSCCYVSLMFHDEWNAFIHEHRQPIEKRPCILCYRRWYTQLLITNRQINLDLLDQQAVKNPESLKFYSSLPANMIFQTYYNLMNEVEGYLFPYMLIPQNNEPLLQPVCALNLNMLKIIIDPITKQQKVDQSAMIFHPPKLNSLIIGESVQNF